MASINIQQLLESMQIAYEDPIERLLNEKCDHLKIPID